jgi:hypothetical protein
MQNIHHFAKKKCPKQHGQRKFLEIFQKNNHIWKKKIMKLIRFLEDFERFLASFFWNSYVANRF